MTSSTVTLLGVDPADQQWSILRYGEALALALIRAAGPRYQIHQAAPDTSHSLGFLRRWRLGRAVAMYQSRYGEYPKRLRKLRSDFFHILDHGNSCLIRHLPAQRTVITCHDLIPLILSRQVEAFFPPISRALYRHAISGLPRAGVLLTNSGRTRLDLLGHFDLSPDRVIVTPLGVGKEFHPAGGAEDRLRARQDLHLPAGSLVLHVGHAVFYKNIEGILHALRHAAGQNASIRLVRAGAFLHPSHWRLANRLGVADRILDLGPSSPSDLKRLYWACDLLLFPSWYEGFGLPALEALASGLPVVVSNRGALPETVGEAGLFVEPDRPAQIAEAVLRLIEDDSLRDRLRKLGLKRASSFSWEKTAERTLAAYDRLLESL